MTKESFVDGVSKMLKPNELELLDELVNATDNAFLERWYLEFLTYPYKDFRAVILSLKAVLRETAHRKAKVGKLKGFKGSREQEKNVLEHYFFVEFMQEKPKWFRQFKPRES